MSNQTLLDALNGLLEAAESLLGTTGVIRGDTPESDDTFIHDEWAEEFLTERCDEARIAIANHARDDNARLIAAAPELLEALQTAAEALCDLPLMDPRIVAIRAAIAKATGEAA